MDHLLDVEVSGSGSIRSLRVRQRHARLAARLAPSSEPQRRFRTFTGPCRWYRLPARALVGSPATSEVHVKRRSAVWVALGALAMGPRVVATRSQPEARLARRYPLPRKARRPKLQRIRTPRVRPR